MPLLPRHGMSPEHRESEREKEKVKEEQKETCIFMCTSVHTHIHFWSIFWSFWGTKISCHQPRSTKKDFSFFFLFSAGCVTKVPIFKSLWTRDLLWNLKNSIRKHNDNHHCLRAVENGQESVNLSFVDYWFSSSEQQQAGRQGRIFNRFQVVGLYHRAQSIHYYYFLKVAL